MRTRVVVPALTVALAMAGLLAPGASLAACTGLGAFTCTVTVSVATPLAFGNYDPAAAAPKDNTTAITVVGKVDGLVGLLVTVSYAIGLSVGSAGNLANRQMVGPVSTTPLGYNLYTTSAHSTVWDASNVTDSYGVTLSLLGTASVTKNYTVYGRIPPGQYVAPGPYSSTITVTVTY
ncbi:spore coat protein U-like protein [Variovorax sp. 54]|uniref:Csu type fimbrial protein n=1 Tax=Variovorax sp. 54 TaxID=2035212 RepID=UPI000C5D3709|nr:spore coat U domain-containing protein [Variovorax sp. 54]PIF74773.1 spore coat protein U-like protein [Variovorax sp. 54]